MDSTPKGGTLDLTTLVVLCPLASLTFGTRRKVQVAAAPVADPPPFPITAWRGTAQSLPQCSMVTCFATTCPAASWRRRRSCTCSCRESSSVLLGSGCSCHRVCSARFDRRCRCLCRSVRGRAALRTRSLRLHSLGSWFRNFLFVKCPSSWRWRLP